MAERRQCYYARVCWNSKGWIYPTGDARSLEVNTYAAKNGFGHEEWLFNPQTFEGYHYAFLQPVGQSFKKLTGKTIDVLLWAINPYKQHVQIGEIRNCEVLTEAQAREALAAYQKNGWLMHMGEDIARVGGEQVKWSWHGLSNIRFRTKDAIQYDQPFPVAESRDKIAKLMRYNLVVAEPSDEDRQWYPRMRQGSPEITSPHSSTRTGWQGGTVELYHRVLQGELMARLQEKFGKENVEGEANWVDITVKIGKRRMLIEVKTYANAKYAIREALGQILEYAYFDSTTQAAGTELFIVAPAPANEQVSTYLNILRNSFRIPIQYCQFLQGSQLPTVFFASNQ